MTTLLIALSGTAIAMPLVISILRGRGVLDIPNHRSSHRDPTPRGAGIACLLGVTAASAVGANLPQVHLALASLVGACVLAVTSTGLIDDLHPLPPLLRLAVQVCAGSVVGALLLGPWGLFLGALMMALSVNAVNFMDGINGISGVTVAVWAGTLWWAGSDGVSPAAAFVGAATLGAALAFLPFNAPRARIFLGDSGSYLFGALIATGLLLAVRDGLPMGLIIAPLLLYAVDVAWTLACRVFRGESLMTAHRDHVYQKLVHGVSLSHSTVTCTLGALSLVLVAVWAWGSTYAAVALTSLIVASYLCLPHLFSRQAGQVRT